jgi:hypothetical protein
MIFRKRDKYPEGVTATARGNAPGDMSDSTITSPEGAKANDNIPR